MANKNLYIIVLFCLFAITGLAQEKTPKNQESDSLQKKLRSDGVIFDDSQLKKTKAINPLAPSKAAFYSAILPGLGQIYNKRYWKVPLVYAAIGTGIYVYDFNNQNYKRFRNAFKSRQAGFRNDEFYSRDPDNAENLPFEPDFLDTNDLENQQERFQRDRDLALVVTIILYALNIVDANVDAHLKQFNIDDNLSMNIEFNPYLDLNPISNNPNYGMAMVIKF